MGKGEYLMEGPQEAVRLDVKTDGALVERQALWGGIRPGMRVADLGCGSGKTTFHLNRLAQPDGRTVGLDIAAQRIDYARSHYSAREIEFLVRDIRHPMTELGAFDFIWIRFVLEYYRRQSFAIVKNAAANLAPGGILCLIDLDCNCLRYHGLPQRLDRAIRSIMSSIESTFDFDPYVGVKLYSFLYDLGFEDIRVDVTPHNLIYRHANEAEIFNWTKKAEIAGRHAGFDFSEFAGGFDEFLREVQPSFADPRVFTYTPLVICAGKKPGR